MFVYDAMLPLRSGDYSSPMSVEEKDELNGDQGSTDGLSFKEQFSVK
jgi:hypothetical protein